MTNDEIRMMKLNKALLICGHHKPIIVRLKPFYKIARLKDFSEIEIPTIAGEINTESLSILPLSHSTNESEKV